MNKFFWALWVILLGLFLIVPRWSDQIENDKRKQTIEILKQSEQSNDVEVKKQAESLRMKLISEAQQEAQQKLKAEKANAEMEEFLHENRALVTGVFVALFIASIAFVFSHFRNKMLWRIIVLN